MKLQLLFLKRKHPCEWIIQPSKVDNFIGMLDFIFEPSIPIYFWNILIDHIFRIQCLRQFHNIFTLISFRSLNHSTFIQWPRCSNRGKFLVDHIQIHFLFLMYNIQWRRWEREKINKREIWSLTGVETVISSSNKYFSHTNRESKHEIYKRHFS